MIKEIKILLSAIKKTFILRCQNHISVLKTYIDMVRTCSKYNIGTNIYVDYYRQPRQERDRIFNECKRYADWFEQYYKDRNFLSEYTSLKYEGSAELKQKRDKAYQVYFNLPSSFACQYGLMITREHYGKGTINAGENLCVARDVDIDLTGDITFGNDVNISEGTKFLTHAHDYDNILGKEIISPDMAYVTPLVVGDDVHFGARCMILPGCNHIGSHSFIGAGAVVTHDVPEWAVVAGNPARVIKMRIRKEDSDDNK